MASKAGGPISRSEVIARAKDWMRQMPPYCAGGQSVCTWYWDIGKTRKYRPDCSGFVDMAWHLNADPNTGGLPKFANPVAKKDLKPGDLLDDVGDGHAVLFEKWADSGHTKIWYYGETHSGASMEHQRGNVSSGSLAGHPAGNYKAYAYKKIQGGGTPPPEQKKTTLAYTGPTSLINGSAAKLSAKLSDTRGKPVANRSVDFALGSGSSEQTCKGTTDADGHAGCTIDPVKQTGESATVTASFAGDDTYAASKDTATVTLKKDTKLAYSGPASVSNGSAAKLAATLKDIDGKAVSGRSVDLALGSGSGEQTCKGTTDADGQAACTVDAVKQPLTDEATVPVAASFAGDDAYNASKVSGTVKLQYVTGRSFGLSADVPLLGLPISIKPTPDTGQVRTAEATTTAPPCAQNVGALLVSAGVLCAKVAAQTGPMSATSTANVADASIGLLGLPVIGLSGVKSTATSTCTAQTGGVDLNLTVAGIPIHVGDTPNLNVDLGVLGTKLVVNEQVTNADGSLTVNAAHLTGPGGINIVVASSTSAAHNCT